MLLTSRLAEDKCSPRWLPCFFVSQESSGISWVHGIGSIRTSSSASSGGTLRFESWGCCPQTKFATFIEFTTKSFKKYTLDITSQTKKARNFKELFSYEMWKSETWWQHQLHLFQGLKLRVSSHRNDNHNRDVVFLFGLVDSMPRLTTKESFVFVPKLKPNTTKESAWSSCSQKNVKSAYSSNGIIRVSTVWPQLKYVETIETIANEQWTM